MSKEKTKIIYLKHKDIDKKQWDNCIKQSSNRIVFALSWYLDNLCPGWDALIEEGYNSVMPLVHRKKYFINYIYNPYFSARLGVFSKNELNNSLLSRFFDKIPSKYRLISIKVNSYKYFKIEKFNSETSVNYELELNKSYEAIYKNFSKNHKKNISRAYKSGIIIKKEHDFGGLIKLKKGLMFRLKNNNLKEFDFENLRNLLSFAQRNNNIITYNAYYNQKLCGSVVFLIKDNRAVKYSATNLTGKKLRAGYLLINSYLKEYSTSDTILDFAGSNIKGIADFNAGFGSERKTFQNFTCIKFPINLFYLLKPHKHNNPA